MSVSFWDVAKKVGGFAVDVGVAMGKEILNAGEEATKNKSLSDDELRRKANYTGFTSRTSAVDRKLAEGELKRRSRS